jgi:anti-sigma regulatory factor (Ser/Thr protein kinase)
MLANGYSASQAVTLRLALQCDLSQVRPMTGAIREFLLANGAAAEEIQASELAIAEACNNAIKYVTGEGQAKNIEVEVLVASEQLELRVNDNTRGFEWPERIDLPDFEQ